MAENMNVSHVLVANKDKLQEHISAERVKGGTLAIDNDGNLYFVDKSLAIKNVARDVKSFDSTESLTEALTSKKVSPGETVTAKDESGEYVQYVIQSEDEGSLKAVPNDVQTLSAFMQWEELN